MSNFTFASLFNTTAFKIVSGKLQAIFGLAVGTFADGKAVADEIAAAKAAEAALTGQANDLTAQIGDALSRLATAEAQAATLQAAAS